MARGMAVRPPDVRTRSGCARRARGPGAVSRLDGRGCVSPGTFARALAVTQSRGFVAAARKRKEVALALSGGVWSADGVPGACGLR